MESVQNGTASRVSGERQSRKITISPDRSSPHKDDPSPLPNLSDDEYEPTGLLLIEQTLNIITKDKFTHVKKETTK